MAQNFLLISRLDFLSYVLLYFFDSLCFLKEHTLNLCKFQRFYLHLILFFVFVMCICYLNSQMCCIWSLFSPLTTSNRLSNVLYFIAFQLTDDVQSPQFESTNFQINCILLHSSSQTTSKIDAF